MREHDVAQLGKRTELNSWAVCDLFILKKVETASSVLNPLDCLERKKPVDSHHFSGSSTSNVLQCAHGVSSTVRHQSGLSHIRHGKGSLVNL